MAKTDRAYSSHNTHFAVVNETMLFCKPIGFLLSSVDMDGPCVRVNFLGKGRCDLRVQEGQQRDKWQAGQAQLHQRRWRSQKPQVFKPLKMYTWSRCSKAVKSPEGRERSPQWVIHYTGALKLKCSLCSFFFFLVKLETEPLSRLIKNNTCTGCVKHLERKTCVNCLAGPSAYQNYHSA